MKVSVWRRGGGEEGNEEMRRGETEGVRRSEREERGNVMIE